MRTEDEMRLRLNRLKSEFNVDVSPANELRGNDLASWVSQAERNSDATFNAGHRLWYSTTDFPPLPPHPLSQKALDKLRTELRLLPKMGYATSISYEKKMERIKSIEAHIERYRDDASGT